MNRFRPVAPQLKIVAYLFLIEGFLWMALAVVQALHGGIPLNPLMLIVWIGWRLLKLSPRAYRWALNIAVGYFVVIVYAGLAMVLVSGITASISPMGFLGAVALGLVLVLKMWQIRVLLSAPVHAVFYPHEAPPEFEREAQ